MIMSEEVKQQEVVDVQPQGQLDAAAKLNKLAALGLSGPSLKDLKTKVAEEAKQASQQQTPAENPVSVAERFKQAAEKAAAIPPVVKNETAQAENQKDAPEKTIEENKSEVKEIDIPLLGKKVIGKKEEESSAPSFKEIDEFVSSKYKDKGISSFEDFSKKFEEIEKTNLELSESKKSLDQLNELISNAPQDLYLALQKYANGEDWKNHIVSNTNIDFAKKATDYDAKTLIENYFPGQVTEEEWNEFNDEDGSSHVKKMIGLLNKEAVEKFTKEQKNRQDQIADLSTREAKRAELYGQSVKSSISKFKSEYSNVDENTVKFLEQNLTKNVIFEKFFDKDGNLQPDAAINFAQVIYGREIQNQLIKYAEDMAKTQANEDLLRRGQKTPTVKGGSASDKKEVRPEVLQKIKSLTSF